MFPTAYSGISIHAAREGGDFISTRIFIAVSISIHAAREGGDHYITMYLKSSGISIHAAREGGDRLRKSKCKYCRDFNPRRP